MPAELHGTGAGGPTDLYVKEAASREADELGIILDSDAWLTGVYYTPAIFGDGSDWVRGDDLPDKSHGRWVAPNHMVGEFSFAYNDEVNYRGDVDPVTGRFVTTVAPAELDTGPSGTDEPNHGLWIGAFNWWMPNVYLVAAEGPNQPGLVYKSWDRFDSIDKFRPAVGFEAAPAGAKGKMIGLSGASAPVVSGGVTVYGQVELSDKETVALEASTSWDERSTDGGTDQNWHLRNLGGNLYRIANTGNFIIIGGPGDLERSIDLGVTWTPVIAQDAPNDRGIVAVTIAADGTLWALWGSHTNTGESLKVYKSTDGGVSWGSPVYTDSGSGISALLPVDIAAHPTNKDIIAVSCIRNSGGARLLTTQDGFATAPALRNMGVTSGTTNGLWLTFGDSGRIIVAGGGSLIQTTDDYGVTWFTRDNPAGTASWWIRRVGMGRIIYSVSPDGSNGGSIRLSPDNGLTWSEYETGNAINPLMDSLSMWAAAIDGEGALIVAFNILTATTGAVFRRRDPWAVSPPGWEDITYDLDSVTDGRISLQGLATSEEEIWD
ncbi:MAG: hypothetical protein A2V88_08840 [Elusimicrobia bacterium RBG_16_66_12]|nr:MAG: hypothetical protein A2V88_08840 [Elusimicrobia bacterium RBG_16_66_12]